MKRSDMREHVQLVLDDQLNIAGFVWSLKYESGERCHLSAETFQEVSREKYRGIGGCELQTWRQGNRQTLAVTASGACRAYCTPMIRTDILELPIAVDLAHSVCSD
jgi:hypothetical protein